MSKPTTMLMEELLKTIDEQQSQDTSKTQPFRGRSTTRLVKPPTTKAFPASPTNFTAEPIKKHQQVSADANVEEVLAAS